MTWNTGKHPFNLISQLIILLYASPITADLQTHIQSVFGQNDFTIWLSFLKVHFHWPDDSFNIRHFRGQIQPFGGPVASWTLCLIVLYQTFTFYCYIHSFIHLTFWLSFFQSEYFSISISDNNHICSSASSCTVWHVLEVAAYEHTVMCEVKFRQMSFALIMKSSAQLFICMLLQLSPDWVQGKNWPENILLFRRFIKTHWTNTQNTNKKMTIHFFIQLLYSTNISTITLLGAHCL